MKVQSTSTNPLLNGLNGGARTDKRSSSSAESSSNTSSVDLSPAARHLASLNNSDADIRSERVQELRDALASGDLTIDPDRIAEGLLSSIKDLLK